MCAVYGHDSVSIYVWHRAGSSFQSGNFDIKDAPRSWKKLSKSGTLAIMISIRNETSNNKTVLNHLEKAG